MQLPTRCDSLIDGNGGVSGSAGRTICAFGRGPGNRLAGHRVCLSGCRLRGAGCGVRHLARRAHRGDCRRQRGERHPQAGPGSVEPAPVEPASDLLGAERSAATSERGRLGPQTERCAAGHGKRRLTPGRAMAEGVFPSKGPCLFQPSVGIAGGPERETSIPHRRRKSRTSDRRERATSISCRSAVVRMIR